METTPERGVLLDYAQDLVVLLDASGRITYANAAVERVLGVAPAQLEGTSAFEHIHPDDRERAREAFRSTVEATAFTETTVEHRFRTADGDWRWLESRMTNLTDDRLDGYVVSARDITDRVRAERERETTAAQLREIASTTGDVLWLFDADWSELLFVNPAYEDVYGQPVGRLEADPQAFLETVHPDDLPAVEEAMALLSAGEPVDMEYRVDPEREYGTWVWVQAEPVREGGEVVRVAGFARDVTDRRRRERQLRVMDNLLRHNLRNDLNTITGTAELIDDRTEGVEELTAVIRRTGDDLLASAEKQRDIIRCLTSDLTPHRLDAATVVRDAAARVARSYPDATVTVSAPPAAPACALDELEVAVVELVENAVRHSPDAAPTVAVDVRPDGEWVVVAVADDAAPLPETEAAVLRGDHEMTTTYHSTGLGLWLVYWVVELSGGRVAEPTHDGTGNTVEIRVPRADEA
jgi:PAS domain S-box-containing protein